ncbi:MAG: 50S ribosomal protein L25/general stress protein Ctc [Hyphomicrobiales bacterium]
MADMITIEAKLRERVGKGAARKERREGNVPAVIYGDGQDPVSISLDYNLMFKLIFKGGFKQTLFEIDVDGTKTRVICRAVQLDPVRDTPVHVDFFRLGKGATLDLEIPIKLLNEEECPGLNAGGALNIVRHTIMVTVRANAIPAEIEIDLINLEVGESLHISQITLPEGSKSTITDRDFTIVSVAAPGGASDEDEDEAEASADDSAETPDAAASED